MQTFPIQYNDSVVGAALIEKIGLYYSIKCDCTEIGKQLFRIIVKTKNQETDLGTCLHSNNKMLLETKVPIKSIKLEDAQFQLCNMESNEEILKIESNLIFEQFPNLDSVKFMKKSDVAHLILNRY